MDILKSAIAQLQAFALAHYEEGGHWVYETHSRDDYIEALEKNDFDLAKTEQYIKQYWERVTHKERDCSWGE